MMENLLKELEQNHTERLRWLICKKLGVSPSELSDENVIKCGLHMLIDKRVSGAEFTINSAFEEESFLGFMRGDSSE